MARHRKPMSNKALRRRYYKELDVLIRLLKCPVERDSDGIVSLGPIPARVASNRLRTSEWWRVTDCDELAQYGNADVTCYIFMQSESCGMVPASLWMPSYADAYTRTALRRGGGCSLLPVIHIDRVMSLPQNQEERDALAAVRQGDCEAL